MEGKVHLAPEPLPDDLEHLVEYQTVKVIGRFLHDRELVS